MVNRWELCATLLSPFNLTLDGITVITGLSRSNQLSTIRSNAYMLDGETTIIKSIIILILVLWCLTESHSKREADGICLCSYFAYNYNLYNGGFSIYHLGITSAYMVHHKVA